MRQEHEDPYGLDFAIGRPHLAFGDDGIGGTASFDPARLSVAAIRALEEAVTRVFGFGAVPVAECRDLQIGSGPDAVPCRLYRGFGAAAPAPLVIYFHGGGFISGSLDSHDGVARALANAARATVLSVGYRLAPEHPYPAALEDGLAVTLRAWHHADHFACDPEGVVLAGDSAGGTIATVIARLLAEEGRPVAGQVLFYPATDLGRARFRRKGWRGLARLERRALEQFRRLVLGRSGDLGDPLLSPLRADIPAGFPPVHIAVGGRDPLREEASDYARRIASAGGSVAFHCYPSQPHGFLGFARVMKDAGPAVAEAGKWIRSKTGGSA